MMVGRVEAGRREGLGVHFLGTYCHLYMMIFTTLKGACIVTMVLRGFEDCENVNLLCCADMEC